MDEFNEQVDKPADETSTRHSPIIVVDPNSDFDPETDTYDGIHPNEIGEIKMAKEWFNALPPVIDDRLSNRVPIT